MHFCPSCAAGGVSNVFGDCGPVGANAEGSRGEAEQLRALMAEQVQRMSQSMQMIGQVVDDVGVFSREVRNVQADMVSRNDLHFLLQRLQRLEGSAVEAFPDDDVNSFEHTGYTDSEADEEESDFDSDTF